MFVTECSRCGGRGALTIGDLVHPVEEISCWVCAGTGWQEADSVELVQCRSALTIARLRVKDSTEGR